MSFETGPTKKHKSHSPTLDKHSWSHNQAIALLHAHSSGQKINWSEAARVIGIPNKNGAVVKPAVQNTYKCCRSRKCILWHIPVHAIFAVFYLFFLLVLCRPSFTSRTPNKDQKTEELFYDRGTLLLSARSSPITRRHS